MEKNIEWFKEEIPKLRGYAIIIDGEGGEWEPVTTVSVKDVLELINQLDEPEVLSQEWIDGSVLTGYPYEEYQVLPAEVLQNLLVPKQELPVIPKFVADWIEKAKRYHSISWLLNFENIKNWSHELTLWCFESGNDDNLHKLARAWLDGYTVEEEPLYRARLKVITDEFIASYLCTQSSDAQDRLKALEIGSEYIHEDYRHLSEFTEDELKKLNIWDSEQWEVKEVRE